MYVLTIVLFIHNIFLRIKAHVLFILKSDFLRYILLFLKNYFYATTSRERDVFLLVGRTRREKSMRDDTVLSILIATILEYYILKSVVRHKTFEADFCLVTLCVDFNRRWKMDRNITPVSANNVFRILSHTCDNIFSH